MQTKTNWQRVSRRRPCPVCGKPDYCLYAGPDDSPEAAICPRTESTNRCGEAGWLHVLRRDGPTWAPWRRTISRMVRRMTDRPNGKVEFARLAATYRAAVKPDALARLANQLGVSVESLHRLAIGWSADHRAWAFPMTERSGGVCGIRLRLPSGRKLSVRGGKEGLFIPFPPRIEGPERIGTILQRHHPELLPLLVCEGPTDTAALLDLGFSAVGRPSCASGVKLLVELVGALKPPEVVIVADGDLPGQRGAENLASALVAYCRSVRVITPPAGVKDTRDWKHAGATTVDVLAAIDAAPLRRLVIQTRRKAGVARG